MSMNIFSKLLVGTAFAATSMLAVSCYKDLGNYDYHEINEITISGLPNEIEILERESITIIPTLASTLAPNEDNYTYEWIAIRTISSDSPGSKVVDTIARTRNLENYPVRLVPNNYDMRYRVTDKTTGVMSEAKFKLDVKTKIYEGFLLMNDIDGAMRLDMLSYRESRFNYIKDVLAEVGSELPPQQGPIKVFIFPDQTYSPGNLAIYLLTQTGANRIHPETFHYEPSYNIKNHFMAGAYPDGFVTKDIQGSSSSFLLYGTGPDGKDGLYNYVRYQNVSWGVKVNMLDNSGIFFNPSPVYSVSARQGSVVFDNDTKSFYKVFNDPLSDILKSKQLPTGSLTSFENTQKELLYMIWNEIGTTPGYKSILKAADNRCYYLSFSEVGAQDKYEEIKANDIYQASHYAIGGEFFEKYIFYSIGGKVYAYDIPNKQSVLVIDKGASTVTHMQFHYFHTRVNSRYNELKNKLIVCSYNDAGKEGVMEFYTIPNTITGNITLSDSYAGFGKIVSLDYRER